MPDPFQFGDIPKPGKYTEARLKMLGISDAKSLVQNYLKSKQDKAQKKINEQIARLIK